MSSDLLLGTAESGCQRATRLETPQCALDAGAQDVEVIFFQGLALGARELSRVGLGRGFVGGAVEGAHEGLMIDELWEDLKNVEAMDYFVKGPYVIARCVCDEKGKRKQN